MYLANKTNRHLAGLASQTSPPPVAVAVAVASATAAANLMNDCWSQCDLNSKAHCI